MDSDTTTINTGDFITAAQINHLSNMLSEAKNKSEWKGEITTVNREDIIRDVTVDLSSQAQSILQAYNDSYTITVGVLDQSGGYDGGSGDEWVTDQEFGYNRTNPPYYGSISNNTFHSKTITAFYLEYYDSPLDGEFFINIVLELQPNNLEYDGCRIQIEGINYTFVMLHSTNIKLKCDITTSIPK